MLGTRVRTRWAVTVIGLLLVATACGNRLSHNEVLDAASRGAGSAAPGTGPSDASADGGASGRGSDAAIARGPAGAAGVAGTSAGNSTTAGGSASSGPRGSAASGGALKDALGGVKAQIVIGNLGTYSGPAGASFGSTPIALQVWSRMVNARGGINGHPVRLITADDGADPARARATVQEMVEARKVVALVGIAVPFTVRNIEPYLEAKRVPVIGGDGVDAAWYRSPMFFADQPWAQVGVHGAVKAVIDEGRKKFAFLYCVEVQACRDAVDQARVSARELGGAVVYDAQISLTQPDFTAECLQARRAGADVLFPGADVNSIRRVAQSCARQGYHPTFNASSVQVTDALASVPELDGFVGSQVVFPWFLTSGSPALQEYGDALRRYAPSMRAGGDASLAWAAAKLFEKVAGTLGDDISTPALLQALWRVRNETLGGLVPPFSFTENKPSATGQCWTLVKVAGRRWTAPRGAEFDCTAHRFSPG